eukprot:4582397-Prymnesium_polylepis.4
MSRHNTLSMRRFPAEPEDLLKTGALHTSSSRRCRGRETCSRPERCHPGPISTTSTRPRCSPDRSTATYRCCSYSTGRRSPLCLAEYRCHHREMRVESTSR